MKDDAKDGCTRHDVGASDSTGERERTWASADVMHNMRRTGGRNALRAHYGDCNAPGRT